MKIGEKKFISEIMGENLKTVWILKKVYVKRHNILDVLQIKPNSQVCTETD